VGTALQTLRGAQPSGQGVTGVFNGGGGSSRNGPGPKGRHGLNQHFTPRGRPAGPRGRGVRTKRGGTPPPHRPAKGGRATTENARWETKKPGHQPTPPGRGLLRTGREWLPGRATTNRRHKGGPTKGRRRQRPRSAQWAHRWHRPRSTPKFFGIRRGRGKNPQVSGVGATKNNKTFVARRRGPCHLSGWPSVKGDFPMSGSGPFNSIVPVLKSGGTSDAPNGEGTPFQAVVGGQKNQNNIGPKRVRPFRASRGKKSFPGGRANFFRTFINVARARRAQKKNGEPGEKTAEKPIGARRPGKLKRPTKTIGLSGFQGAPACRDQRGRGSGGSGNLRELPRAGRAFSPSMANLFKKKTGGVARAQFYRGP